MAIVKSILDQKIKEKRIESSSEEFKNSYRLKTLEDIFSQLGSKENRFIFYCPDITLVNNLVKTIYETAYEVYSLGYNVLVLHEIDGYKCKWLFNQKEYSHLKEVPTDHIIKKKSSKSKKTKSMYSFKPSDTLIVPDQFQEMLDNLMDVKLIQKVVLVSSYTGLSALNPGMDYNSLGVEHLIYTDKRLAEDYNELFTTEHSVLSGLPINKDFFKDREDNKVLPLISVSNIGNADFAQQVINVFYNKYPNLRVFNFRILDRDNLEIYKENFKNSALVLLLDKTLGNSQFVEEAISMGVPVGTFKRQELETSLLANIFLGDTPFEIADQLAFFCQTWLNNKTEVINSMVKEIKTSKTSYETFSKDLEKVFEKLHDNRIKFFARIKESMNA